MSALYAQYVNGLIPCPLAIWNFLELLMAVLFNVALNVSCQIIQVIVSLTFSLLSLQIL